MGRGMGIGMGVNDDTAYAVVYCAWMRTYSSPPNLAFTAGEVTKNGGRKGCVKGTSRGYSHFYGQHGPIISFFGHFLLGAPPKSVSDI